MRVPSHRRQPRHPVRVVLAGVKGTALGTLLSLVVVGALRTEAVDTGASARTASDSYQRIVQRSMAGHGCSQKGFGEGRVPASALIRTRHGELRQVSFRVGWEVFNGHRPGTLVAVCLDRARR